MLYQYVGLGVSHLQLESVSHLMQMWGCQNHVRAFTPNRVSKPLAMDFLKCSHEALNMDLNVEEFLHRMNGYEEAVGVIEDDDPEPNYRYFLHVAASVR